MSATIEQPLAGFIAGIEYPSGRRIYCDEHARLGEFIDNAQLAHVWPDETAANQALESLLRFFEIRDRSPLKLFIKPCRSSPC